MFEVVMFESRIPTSIKVKCNNNFHSISVTVLSVAKLWIIVSLHFLIIEKYIVRFSLGLNAKTNYMNKEKQILLGNYVMTIWLHVYKTSSYHWDSAV